MEVLKYKVNGEWKEIIALQGKPGEKGKPFEYEDFTPEQLEKLKGEPGENGIDGKDGINGKDGTNGIDGKDGYTPIKGTDYWTTEEQTQIKNELKNYIDEQLGVIENGSY